MVHGSVTAFWRGSARPTAAAIAVIVFAVASKRDVPSKGSVVHLS